MRKMEKYLVAAAAMCLPFIAAAKVKLPNIFTSNMVLQQNATLSIPCTAKPNATVKVTTSLNNETTTFQTDADGKFTFTFDVPKASNKTFWIRFSDGESILLNNLLAGEVWLCGGQSNMEMPVQGWGCVLNYEQEVANANYPNIRMLQVDNTLEFAPQEEAKIRNGGWMTCQPSTVANFSALGYFFGRALNQKMNIPIGLVYSAWGGTPAESWVSFQAAKDVGGFESSLNLYQSNNFDANKILAVDPNARHFQKPTLEYNAMIYPLRIMPIAGAIWYQGESNVGRDEQYTRLFKRLIQNWRAIWKNDFAFYFVQLAGYMAVNEMQPGSTWASLRWAQKDALELENTGMATAIDIGEVNDIHPKNKQEVGRRLSLLALKNTYGYSDIIDKAPVLKSYSFTSRKAVLTFSEKFTVKGSVQPKGFIIEKPDRSFIKAKCTLVNDSTVSLTGIFTGIPRSVRYNWADFPLGNLYGPNDLPVLPFRTDQMDGSLNGIEIIESTADAAPVNVYNLDGVLLRKNVEPAQATANLPRGIYVVGKEKVMVK